MVALLLVMLDIPATHVCVFGFQRALNYCCADLWRGSMDVCRQRDLGRVERFCKILERWLSFCYPGVTSFLFPASSVPDS